MYDSGASQRLVSPVASFLIECSEDRSTPFTLWLPQSEAGLWVTTLSSIKPDLSLARYSQALRIGKPPIRMTKTRARSCKNNTVVPHRNAQKSRILCRMDTIKPGPTNNFQCARTLHIDIIYKLPTSLRSAPNPYQICSEDSRNSKSDQNTS